MKEIKRVDFSPLNGRLASLCWEGDQLVDFGGGIIRYSLNGEGKQRWSGYGYSFDGAVYSEHGSYAITYQRLGTKALILKDDQIVREINRSYYCADVYEYPMPSSKERVAECKLLTVLRNIIDSKSRTLRPVNGLSLGTRNPRTFFTPNCR